MGLFVPTSHLTPGLALSEEALNKEALREAESAEQRARSERIEREIEDARYAALAVEE